MLIIISLTQQHLLLQHFQSLYTNDESLYTNDESFYTNDASVTPNTVKFTSSIWYFSVNSSLLTSFSNINYSLLFNFQSSSIIFTSFNDNLKAHILYAYAAVSMNNIIKPTTYKQAINSSLCNKWKKAMKKKIYSLKYNNMWNVMTNSQNQHVLQSQWVYKIKHSADDHITHYKTHWVVKGYKQQFNVDYNQTFASVIKSQTYKALFALVTYFNLKMN